jgi:hypothetical protein
MYGRGPGSRRRGGAVSHRTAEAGMSQANGYATNKWMPNPTQGLCLYAAESSGDYNQITNLILS